MIFFLSYSKLWLIMTSVKVFLSFHYLTFHFSVLVNRNLRGANTYYCNILNGHLAVWRVKEGGGGLSNYTHGYLLAE